MNIEITNSKGEKFVVRPCPFCGGTPRFGRHNFDEILACSNGDLSELDDNYCNAYVVGSYSYSDESGSTSAVKMWNRRVKQ